MDGLDFSDEYFMKQALKEAGYAYEEDEVPVGAVVVSGNKIIARAYNQTEKLNDVTAHAEILAITAAANHLGAKFLTDCTLYVTMEPCVMCAGAIAWARPYRIVFGARDEKRGFSKLAPNAIHPKTLVSGGIMIDECSLLVKEFFKAKRG